MAIPLVDNSLVRNIKALFVMINDSIESRVHGVKSELLSGCVVNGPVLVSFSIIFYVSFKIHDLTVGSIDFKESFINFNKFEFLIVAIFARTVMVLSSLAKVGSDTLSI
jgi:phage-related holin